MTSLLIVYDRKKYYSTGTSWNGKITIINLRLFGYCWTIQIQVRQVKVVIKMFATRMKKTNLVVAMLNTELMKKSS